MEKGELLYTVGEVDNTATTENSMEVLMRLKIEPIYDPADTLHKLHTQKKINYYLKKISVFLYS